MPGEDIPAKTFTVTNSGNSKVDDYVVAIIDVINTLSRTGDLTYTLTCEEYNSDDEKVGDCNGVSNELNSEYGPSYPTHPTAIVLNSIEEGYRHEYSLKLNYVNLTNVDQSDDMGSTISGKVQIYGNTDTIEMTGTVTGASDGDYVQINSEQMTSEIVDGKYKLVGVEPGVHSVKIMNASGVKQSEQYIKINKGQTAGFETGDIKLSESVTVTGPVITMTESTGTATVNLVETIVDEESTLTGTATSIENYNPFNTGTLAYKILNNAYSVTETQEKTNGYAVYRRNPLTKPAVEINNSDEASLSVTEDNYGNSYYFRGNVKNNYVTFNNMCWRVLRIDGNKNIKLILESYKGVCNEDNITTDSGSLGENASLAPGIKVDLYEDNLIYIDDDNNIYLDYYNCVGEVGSEYCTEYNEKSMNITPLKNKEDMLVKIGDTNDLTFYNINGDKVEYLEEEGGTYEGENYYTAAYLRYNNLAGNKVSLNVKASGESYISFITVDEAAFAGLSKTPNSSTFITNNISKKYYTLNFAVGSLVYWLDTQLRYGIAADGTLDVNIDEEGYFEYGVAYRPVIMLSSIVTATGSGTLDNPYVINETVQS